MPAFSGTDPGGSVPTGGGGASTAAGVLAAGAQIYDTYQSSKTAKYNTDRTIAANQAQADLAYQREIEMWNRMNAYNDPSAQMARYQAAGLNPHMVGQSGTGAGNASTMPRYNPPNVAYRYEAPQPGSALASILPVMMQVGTWMQSMRWNEEKIKGQEISNLYKVSQNMRARQLLEYATEANPELVKQLRAKNRLLGYQASTESHRTGKEQWLERAAYGKVLSEFGDDFTSYYMRGGKHEKIGGMTAQRMKKLGLETDILSSKAAIERANAAYADYGVTNPQSIINLVVGSALSMATGKTVRVNRNSRQLDSDVQKRRLSSHVSARKEPPIRFTRKYPR